MFVIPLVAVFYLYFLGVTTEVFIKVFNKNIPLIKLMMFVLFFFGCFNTDKQNNNIIIYYYNI